MDKRWLALGVVILLLALFYSSYDKIRAIYLFATNPTPTTSVPTVDAASGLIDRQRAISLAEESCAQEFPYPKKSPSNFQTNLMTEKEARVRIQDFNPGNSTRAVWLVSMDGVWEHTGGPRTIGETPMPLIFIHCRVMLDAKTGERMVLTN
jgi:hypothetical protein